MEIPSFSECPECKKEVDWKFLHKECPNCGYKPEGCSNKEIDEAIKLNDPKP